MGAVLVRRWLGSLMLGALLVVGAGLVARAQDTGDLDALNKQVGALYSQGKYSEAVEVAKRSLALAEMNFGPDHLRVSTSLNNLAALFHAQGRTAEAEPLHMRSLAIRERALGPDHPDVGDSVNNLAMSYLRMGRHAEAEPLMKRSLTIAEKALGPEHPSVGNVLNNLSLLYLSQGRRAEAEPLMKRSLTITEKALGPEHPNVGHTLNSLAYLYREQGRYAEAEPLHKRALAIAEKSQGPEHPAVGNVLTDIAMLYAGQGRYAEAELVSRRALAIAEKALGPEHSAVANALNNLAVSYIMQRDWVGAADSLRRSTGIIVRHTQRGTSAGGRPVAGQRISKAEESSHRFQGLIRVAFRIASDGSGAEQALANEMFETAQWAQSSEAAASLAQMAARGAISNAGLGRLVRDRQDLAAEWQKRHAAKAAAVSQLSAKRDHAAEATNTTRLAAIDTKIAEIDKRLASEFPDYAALASPGPLSVANAQAALRRDEALILFLDTDDRLKPIMPEESFLWVVTKNEMRWVRIDLGTSGLTREVAALRCGLDATEWDGDGREKCAKALGIPLDKAPGGNEPLPFDHGRAHKLYSALFAEVRDLIKGKHILIVPSGSLTQLPFQVLVTKASTFGDHRGAAWLIREHAVTVLPAVSSLKALRRVGRPSAAPRAMIGFGNPLLDGPDARYAEAAKLAREKQRCPETRRQRIAALVGLRRGVSRVEMRGGVANVAAIKAQTPLPETADELCAVAQDVKAGAGDIRLAAQATEGEIKRLNAAGELAKYRMVHFATHGVLAGELDGTHEPGLILTPPEAANEDDDGYLSASEIATLKLDADWVILSACNTAAGAATSAEALSGLARAFIYAQARALLVSHWAVYSDATVKLITVAVREVTRDAKVGRAEALRRSMLALIDKGEPHEAHPAYWAPFVVVGEGAAGP